MPEPGNLQSFNRYSYCVNNPVIYSDPSGHEPITLGVAIGLWIATFSASYSATRAIMAGETPMIAIGRSFILAVFSMGAWNLGAGYVCGQTTAVGFVNSLSGSFTAGAFSGAVNAGMYGGNPWQAALIGGITAAAMAAVIRGAAELIEWANPSGEGSAGEGQDQGRMSRSDKGGDGKPSGTFVGGPRLGTRLSPAQGYDMNTYFNEEDIYNQQFGRVEGEYMTQVSRLEGWAKEALSQGAKDVAKKTLEKAVDTLVDVGQVARKVGAKLSSVLEAVFDSDPNVVNAPVNNGDIYPRQPWWKKPF